MQAGNKTMRMILLTKRRFFSNFIQNIYTIFLIYELNRLQTTS